jgi:hypothetical protein
VSEQITDLVSQVAKLEASSESLAKQVSELKTDLADRYTTKESHAALQQEVLLLRTWRDEMNKNFRTVVISVAMVILGGFVTMALSNISWKGSNVEQGESRK